MMGRKKAKEIQRDRWGSSAADTIGPEFVIDIRTVGKYVERFSQIPAFADNPDLKTGIAGSNYVSGDCLGDMD